MLMNIMQSNLACVAAAGLDLREHEPMSRHTNFRIGGPARYYVEARTPEEAQRAIEVARSAGLPWFVLGGGSNTLVADAGFDGVVIQLANREVRVDGMKVIAGAGAISAAVARAAGEAGLTGFEWAISLPGTIGGAVRGNAGCFGGEMRDVVETVRVLEVSDVRCPNFAKASLDKQVSGVAAADCDFRYRHSAFKEHPEQIILEVTLALRSGDRAECQRRMDEHLTRRKAKQPLERPSAGCLFTNVECRMLNAEQLDRLDRATSGAWRTVTHDGQIPTGWLIDQLELRGYRVGNVMVSEKHGNFVINLGDGTAADVVAVADHLKRRARDVFGIELREEVQRMGFVS